tara:strand:- start:49 stop:522 length:474 start_codon:yes stop_codon:yes gene_type:complete
MEKFLNIKLSDGSVTPVRISGVSVIKFAADVGTGNTLQTDLRINYVDGGAVKILSQQRGSANAVFIPSAAGQKTEFVRALYQKIIEAVATPWNLPVIGGDDGWDYSVEPSSSQSSSYAKQGDGGGGANFAAKQSAALQGTGSSSTGDVSPMLSVEAV